jgi:hypothetical protein
VEEIIAGPNSALENLSFGGMGPFLDVDALWVDLRNRKRERKRKGKRASYLPQHRALSAAALCSI